MADLKIRVFSAVATEPDTTVTIPGGALRATFGVVPKDVLLALQQKGIDLIELSKDPHIHASLLEIEDHQKNEKVVIALE